VDVVAESEAIQAMLLEKAESKREERDARSDVSSLDEKVAGLNPLKYAYGAK